MITIVVASVLFVLGYVLTMKSMRRPDLEDVALVSVMYVLFAGLIFTIFTLWSVHFEGLKPNYGSGRIKGHLVWIDHQGAIWKTHEGAVKYGEHQDHVIPVTFTPEQAALLQNHIGDLLEVDYQEWLVMPYREGSSGRKATAIRIQPRSP